MNRFAALIVGAFLTLCACASPTIAAHRGNPTSTSGGGGSCPYGSTFADGCTTAPHVGLNQDATFFTTIANFNGVTVVRPTHNVAGVDYGVGQYTADGSLANPITTLAACTPTGTHYVLCNGSGTLTISGYIFNDVCLEIAGTYTQVNLTNNHFIIGTNVDSTQCGLGAPQQFAPILLHDLDAGLDDEFNTYDEASFFGAGSAGLIDDTRSKAHSNAHTTKHWYNYLKNMTSKFTVIDHCGDQSWRYNASHEWPAPSGDRQHAEIQVFCFDADTVNLAESLYNFAWESSTQSNIEQPSCGGTTTIDYWSSGTAFGATYAHVVSTGNVYVIAANSINSAPTCGGSPTKVQADAAIYFQMANFTVIDMDDNWIFPKGANFCFNSTSAVVGTLNWGTNHDLFDNSIISSGITANACGGHG